MRAGRVLGVLTAVMLLCGLAGCATPAKPTAMQAVQLTPVHHYAYSVVVETQGGSATGALDSTNISDADLKAAIEQSIVQSNLFKQITASRTGADYVLSVTLASFSKPIFGSSFTVKMEAGWTLIRLSDHSVVMRKLVRSAHTATMQDAGIGVTRLRLAVEGAAQSNIEQGLKAIDELGL